MCYLFIYSGFVVALPPFFLSIVDENRHDPDRKGEREKGIEILC